MIRSINQTREQYYLLLSGLTWKKKYYQLFDYDQNKMQSFVPFKQQLQAKQTYFLIFRDKKSYQLSIELKKQMKKLKAQDLGENKALICGGKIMIKDKNFQIKFYQPDEILYETESQIWLQNQHHVVVRSLKNSQKQPIGYRLQPKNIIKIGNREFFIHTIETNQNERYSIHKKKFSQIVNIKKKCENSQNQGQIDYLVSNNKKIYIADNQKIKESDQCKYCMSHQSQAPQDFLCAPCKCIGSCGLVHFYCLVKWNQKKVKKTENKCFIQYNFEKFFCQVCKEEYPQYIRKKQTVYELLPIEKPIQGYMILQDFYSPKRHVIIIKDIKQTLVIGRSNQCQLKIQQNTISRRHAQIKKINGQYFIFDLKSKYGTLVKQINMSIILRRNNKFSIQAGSSLLTFSLQEKNKQ